MSHNSPLCHQCHRKGQSGMKFTMNVYTLKFKMFNHLPGISCFLWTSHVNTSNQVLNMALTGKQNPKFHSHHCKFLTSFLTPCASHMWNKELTFISECSLYSYNKIDPYLHLQRTIRKQASKYCLAWYYRQKMALRREKRSEKRIVEWQIRKAFCLYCFVEDSVCMFLLVCWQIWCSKI